MNDELKIEIERSVANALREDVGNGDRTAALIDADTVSGATVVARESMIIAGVHWFDEVFRQCDASIEIEWQAGDGEQVGANSSVARVSGPARAVLTAERSALNFLQTLSGTATVTRRYADLVEGTGCRILDTRKTIPQLRHAQKYAAVFTTPI